LRPRKDLPAAGQHLPVAAAGPYALLNDVLDELVAAGGPPPGRRQGADVACWAGVHGFAVLCLRGPLRTLPPAERDASLDVTLDIIDRGLS
jgi:hypothetical protein